MREGNKVIIFTSCQPVSQPTYQTFTQLYFQPPSSIPIVTIITLAKHNTLPTTIITEKKEETYTRKQNENEK